MKESRMRTIGTTAAVNVDSIEDIPEVTAAKQKNACIFFEWKVCDQRDRRSISDWVIMSLMWPANWA